MCGLRPEGVHFLDCWRNGDHLFQWTNYFWFHPYRRHHSGCRSEVDDDVGGTIILGMDMIDEVGDRVSEGKATGAYGTWFTVGSLERKEPGMGRGNRGSVLVL